MWRCSSCNLVWDGESAPSKCPKCGTQAERFTRIEPSAADRIERARFTNALLMQLSLLLDQVMDLAEDGMDEGLDRACVSIFEEAMLAAEPLQQAIKAEMEAHVKQQQWG